MVRCEVFSLAGLVVPIRRFVAPEASFRTPNWAKYTTITKRSFRRVMFDI